MVHAQALIYRVALTKMGESGAKVGDLRGVTRSLANRQAVAPELPVLKKYLNVL